MPTTCVESDFGQPVDEQKKEDTVTDFEPVARMDSTDVDLKPIEPISDNNVLSDSTSILAVKRETHRVLQPVSQSTSMASLVPAVTNSTVFAVNLSESEYKVLEEDQPSEGLVDASREIEYEHSTRELVAPVSRAQLPTENDGDVLNGG